MNFVGLPRLKIFVEKHKVDSITLLWSRFPNFQWVQLHLNKALNPIKLIDELYELEGTRFVSSNEGCIGDGDNISVRRKPGYVEIDFSHGWGDCSSGCIRRKGWVFSVRNNRVKLVKRYKS